MFDVGRVCLKVAGREAGKYCVIVNRIDENFVTVTGPKELTEVKRRRCNVSHLEPIVDTLEIKADASDEEVMKAYQKANLLEKLNLVKKERKHTETKAKAEKKPQAAKKAKPAKTKKAS